MRRSLKLFQYGTVAPCSNHTCSSWGNHYIGGDIYSLIGANCYCKSCIDNLIEQVLEEHQVELTQPTNDDEVKIPVEEKTKAIQKPMGRPKKVNK